MHARVEMRGFEPSQNPFASKFCPRWIDSFDSRLRSMQSSSPQITFNLSIDPLKTRRQLKSDAPGDGGNACASERRHEQQRSTDVSWFPSPGGPISRRGAREKVREIETVNREEMAQARKVMYGDRPSGRRRMGVPVGETMPADQTGRARTFARHIEKEKGEGRMAAASEGSGCPKREMDRRAAYTSKGEGADAMHMSVFFFSRKETGRLFVRMQGWICLFHDVFVLVLVAKVYRVFRLILQMQTSGKSLVSRAKCDRRRTAAVHPSRRRWSPGACLVRKTVGRVLLQCCCTRQEAQSEQDPTWGARELLQPPPAGSALAKHVALACPTGCG